MTSLAAALIITSAFMHASWNFISKQRSPTLAFFWITVVFSALLMSPLLMRYRHAIPLVEPSVWLLILATGTAQMVYFFGLAGAYKSGDISLAYPLARALPVLLIAGISFLLGRGHQIGALSLVGMAFITAGCIVLPMHTFREVRWRSYLNIVTLMALIAAIGTTGYTLIDDQILRSLRETSTLDLSAQDATLLFMALQTISSAAMLGVGALVIPSERRQLPGMMRSPRFMLLAMATGLIVTATYGLVLASMAYVSNVSYVAAFRQLSIPIGAMLGFTLAQEPRYSPKLWGIGIVTLGLLLVGVG